MNRHERYNRSPEGQARYARYRETEKGHANERVQHGRLRVRERVERLRAIEEELSHYRV